MIASMPVSAHPSSPPRRVDLGLTLAECLLAIVVLWVAVLGLSFATTAGHQHLNHGDRMLRAVRLAEHLMEEIQSRPYSGSGIGRPSYHIDDYNGFNEAAGELRDFAGDLYDDADQIFNRSVAITSASQTVGSLDGLTISGKTIVITLEDAAGAQWTLSRFVPEPASP